MSEKNEATSDNDGLQDLSANEQGKKQSEAGLLKMFHKFRMPISHSVFVLGLIAGVVVTLSTEMYTLAPHSNYRTQIVNCFIFPALALVINALLLTILSDIYKTNWGEELKRMKDMKEFSDEDTLLAKAIKLTFCFLLLVLTALGGYVTAIGNIFAFLLLKIQFSGA